MHNEPFIFDWNLPKSLSTLYPVMAEVLLGIGPNTTTHTTVLKTTMGRQLQSFAKSHSFNEGKMKDTIVLMSM